MEEIMIVTTRMITDDLGKRYSNPKSKLGRLVKDGKYTPIIRGLYETEPSTPGYLLSGIYSPSYLSFEYALSRYGLIPESVFEYTSATCGKNRTKRYDTPFGTYSYRDVPKNVFRFAIELKTEGEYNYWIASPEKAVCDELYSLKPIPKKESIEALLFDDLRMDKGLFKKLDKTIIDDLVPLYRSYNVYRLNEYISGVSE